ncbi:MAG: 4Fe-4S binding protein [Promethearchaeota archaeon]
MEFYYPIIINKKECRGCEDCVRICPEQAISYNNDNWGVNKEKCKNYQKKIQDLCMNCVEYCRKNIIRLQEGK